MKSWFGFGHHPRQDLKLLLAASRQQSGACTVEEAASLPIKKVALSSCRDARLDWSRYTSRHFRRIFSMAFPFASSSINLSR